MEEKERNKSAKEKIIHTHALLGCFSNSKISERERTRTLMFVSVTNSARYFVRVVVAHFMHLYILLFQYNCNSFFFSFKPLKKNRSTRERNSFGCWMNWNRSHQFVRRNIDIIWSRARIVVHSIILVVTIEIFLWPNWILHLKSYLLSKSAVQFRS